jgi:hypothetical protein
MPRKGPVEVAEEEDDLDSFKEELHVGGYWGRPEPGQIEGQNQAAKEVKNCLDVISGLIPSSLCLESKHNS